ncbi:MAG: (Fe-S)-binding protein [Burkholderiales bacterium]|nr:(Fe-S)-binding protein [Burkholderiales bacterium]
MSERVVFWYGCNVLRHGDIIHAAIEVLRAAGIESSPLGGPGYCCGSPKDGNLRAAEGMAVRTVRKFNALPEEQVVTWCPSCHRHMGAFMSQYQEPNFSVAHISQVLHQRRDRLAERMTCRIERRVVLHQHSGFREVDVGSLVHDLLALIPGLEIAPASERSPGHMCSPLLAVPAAMKDNTRRLCELAQDSGADDVVTIFHSCQRLLCGLETTEPFRVVNYIALLAQALGYTHVDEFKQWKNAGSAQAVEALIGAQRIERIGRERLAQVLPDILRKPVR